MSGSKLTLTPRTSEVTVRGITFKFHEVSGREYDNAIALCTNAENDEVDTQALFKMLLMSSLDEPKLTVDELDDLPHPVRRAIIDASNTLHFAAASDEGNASAQATS